MFCIYVELSIRMTIATCVRKLQLIEIPGLLAALMRKPNFSPVKVKEE